ncbi:MAG: hypothetical protein GTO40_06100 [Deltaproteobacteria bacterium]|nr:hypothetical protein [Deltaproteobacteria bacterium]
MNHLPRKVCISGPTDRPWVESKLRANGCEVVLGMAYENFPEHCYDDESLIKLISDSDVLLVSSRERVPGKVLEQCYRLRGVVKASIGVENVDISAATDLKILVCNSPVPENFVGVAEATIGLMVSLMKRLKLNEQDLAQGRWKKETNTGDLISGKTIGIVGLGRVGKAVAKRLQGWDVRVIAYDPYIKREVFEEVGAEGVTFAEILRRSDVLSLHVVLTGETRHMIGLKELKSMKPTAYLVNTSRGGVINQEELSQALGSATIAGAALDVYEEEPLPLHDPLRSIDTSRLILTPHSIANSPAARDAGHRMAVDSILSLLAGKVPSTVLNPEAIAQWEQRFFHPLP